MSITCDKHRVLHIPLAKTIREWYTLSGKTYSGEIFVERNYWSGEIFFTKRKIRTIYRRKVSPNKSKTVFKHSAKKARSWIARNFSLQLKVEETFFLEEFCNPISKIVSKVTKTNLCAPRQTTPKFHSI